MSKTGSISYFLIISIIIVISIFIYSIRKTSDQPFQKTSDFTRIDQFIESCLRETSISSIRKQGLDGSSSAFYLKHQIKQDIPYCLSNFTQFEDEGFRVIISPELDVNVTITDESISVKLYHPVNFEKDSNYTFYEAAFEMPRTSVIKLDPSKELSLISPDGSFILQIPKGTSASKNGEKINEIGIKLNDKNFNDLSNDPIASQLSFEGIPHGTVFSKPITIQMFYQEQDIPITVREDELNLGFFDDKGIWIAVPTTIDTKSNKIIAEIKHFTPLSVVMNCDDGDKNSFKFETPNLLLQRCNPCETDGTSPFWFRPITDDEKKYGFDIFAREDYGNILMSEEIPFSPCDENDECLVTICENKQVIDSEGNSLNLWGYNKIEDLEGERVYKLQFEGGGDSCIKASSIDELDNIDVFFEKEDYEDWPDDESFLTEHDLIISPIGCSNDDECKITPSRPLWEFDDKKNPVLSFSYNIKNKDIDNAADACIHGRAIAVYNGVGISDSYIECEIEGTYDYILFSEEGKSCSQCKNQDGKKIWVPAEDSFCNNEDFCVSTIEGAAKLIISGDGDSISEKKCQICQHGKWTDTELATCGSCDLSVMGDSFDSKEIRCFMEAECNDPAKQAILEKAISLHGIDPSMCGMKKGEERIKCLEGSTSTGQFLSAMTKDLDEKSMEDLLFVLARR
ncbi:MAG: hypothetical protein NDI94_02440, partial [Candidatus Woesearchaeota archaeon]|nr:hypothetical protein [Candidatus Woesearchaeota archaeon]